MAPKLFLASNSPRRRQLLALTGWEFLVQPADIDEREYPGEPPSDYVLRLAESKALAVDTQAQPGDLILAADTTVADDHRILGKPTDDQEARDMLCRLRGRAHTVYTAIAVSDPYTGRLLSDLCATRVWMRDYSDAEIEAYIASRDPFDKAGGYAIQNAEFHPVARIDGCYSCVVGLPVCRVVGLLARFGMQPPDPITASCSAHLETNTPCLVYETLLRLEKENSDEALRGDQAQGKGK